MKKLTAMLAIVLSLMLAMSCALAEDSTMYSLSLLDPVLTQNGETAIDLTGLNIDVVAFLTDGVEQGLSLELYSGENYDYITSLQIQFAEEGIVLFLDGMSQSYCLPYDAIAELTDNEMAAPLMNSIAPVLKNAAMRSTIAAVSDQVQQAIDGINVDDLRWLPAMSKASEIELDSEGKCVFPIQLSMEDSAAAISDVLAQIQSVASVTDVNCTVEGCSAEGEMVVYGPADAIERYTIDLSGEIKIEDNDYVYPYTLTMDVSKDDASGRFATTDANGVVSEAVLSKVEDTGDPTIYEAYTLDMLEDGGYYASVVFQRADDEGDWTTITTVKYGEAQDGSEDLQTSVSFVTDFNADADYSWGVTYMSFTGDPAEAEDSTFFYFTYEGVDATADDGNPYRDGYLTMGADVDGDSYDFQIRAIEMRNDLDSESWVIPFADSVDVSSMSDSDMNSAQMGLMGVIGEVVATLQEQYPFFENLFAGMGM